MSPLDVGVTKTGTIERFRFHGVSASQLATRVTFALCGVIAAITLVAALRMYIPLFATRDATVVQHSLDAAAERWAPATDAFDDQPEPVRVSNPFDASEVFEFPAGTPPAEARAAVAEMLLDRARDRYAQIDARTAGP